MSTGHDHPHDHPHDHDHPQGHGQATDGKHDGVRVIPGNQLDGNTAQTPGMDRKAAINFARVGAQKLWAGTVTIHAVEASEVDSIELRRENESGHSSGDLLAVLALGYTNDGQPIYGIEYSCTAPGSLDTRL